jgi:uncharacterized protein YkwD/uncharacterized membrane protein required for colicin V production
MILTDLALLTLLALAAYFGARRGLILVALEVVSFVVATLLAILLYPSLGGLIRHVFSLAAALSNVAGFLVVWMVVEILSALLIRLYVMDRIPHQLHQKPVNQAGGAALNLLKTAALLAIALIFYAGLPISAAAKRPVTDSNVAKFLLSVSGTGQRWLESGLGRDLSDSLTVFTVTSDPESEKRIELGFTTTSGVVDPQAEDAMLVLINRERAAVGQPPLVKNSKAQAVARAYSKRMLAEGYFSHIDNDGHSPFDRMKAGGVSYESAGENLALAPTLQLAHQGLMNSPGHRANILSPNYGSVGIGIIDAGQYGLMVTQDFTN